MHRTITLVFGKTGMGKSLYAKSRLGTFRRVFVFDPLAEYPGILRFGDVGDMIEHVQQHPVFRVGTEFDLDFPMLCAVAMAARDCLLVVDEANRILSPRIELPYWFERVIYEGRHRRVSLMLVSQRPSTVNIAARSQWTEIISFRQTEPADVKWIEDQAGESLGLESLDVGEFRRIRPDGITWDKLDIGALVARMGRV